MEEENEEIIEKVSTKACDGEELIFVVMENCCC